jgi:hypothetical protein
MAESRALRNVRQDLAHTRAQLARWREDGHYEQIVHWAGTPERADRAVRCVIRPNARGKYRLMTTPNEYTLNADLMPCCGVCGKQLSLEGDYTVISGRKSGWYCVEHGSGERGVDPMQSVLEIWRRMEKALAGLELRI